MLIATPMDGAAAAALGERIRALIDGHVFQHDGKRITVTVSVGVSTWQPSLREDFEELIRLSDDALYGVKEEGWNRVRSARI